MKNLKFQGLKTYKYKNDNSITIKKTTYVNEKNNELHKYTAEINSIFAKNFPSEEDAVKELKRKINNQKQNKMSNINELKKQLELAQSQVESPMISSNPLLKESAQRKIAELKKQIAEQEGEDETKNAPVKNAELQKLMDDLKLAEEGIKMEMIAKNPVLRESTENKIQELKQKIKAIKGDKETKKEELKTSVKVDTKTKETPKQKEQPKEKPAKTEKPKKSESKQRAPKADAIQKIKGLKIGDKVEFENKDTGKKQKGTLVRLELCWGKTDDYNAYVQVGDQKIKIRAKKVTAI